MDKIVNFLPQMYKPLKKSFQKPRDLTSFSDDYHFNIYLFIQYIFQSWEHLKNLLSKKKKKTLKEQR